MKEATPIAGEASVCATLAVALPCLRLGRVARSAVVLTRPTNGSFVNQDQRRGRRLWRPSSAICHGLYYHTHAGACQGESLGDLVRLAPIAPRRDDRGGLCAGSSKILLGPDPR